MQLKDLIQTAVESRLPEVTKVYEKGVKLQGAREGLKDCQKDEDLLKLISNARMKEAKAYWCGYSNDLYFHEAYRKEVEWVTDVVSAQQVRLGIVPVSYSYPAKEATTKAKEIWPGLVMENPSS